MLENPYQPVFELTRGPAVESIHFGAIAISDSQNHLIAWYGDPDLIAFLRSSAKPFQALPFIEHRGHEAYSLTPREIALICASHSGTDEHVAVLQAIQAKTGVKEGDLLCGTHPLSYKPTIDAMRERGEEVTPNRHNCSGKHTGMLAYLLLKKQRGLDIPDEIPYISRDHPLQKEILQTFADMCGLAPSQVLVGVDGCSVPTFGVPLRNAALAYARLADPSGLGSERAEACQSIVSSMMSHPFMVGGPESFDTDLMEATGGKIVCKGGAEGYQALGILPGAIRPGSPGLGVTLKISDGDLGGHNPPTTRYHGNARPAVALETLRQLGALTEGELRSLAGYEPAFKIHNWREIEVGQARPVFQLKRTGW